MTPTEKRDQIAKLCECLKAYKEAMRQAKRRWNIKRTSAKDWRRQATRPPKAEQTQASRAIVKPFATAALSPNASARFFSFTTAQPNAERTASAV